MELAFAMVLLSATEVLVKDYRGKNAEQNLEVRRGPGVADQRRADASCFMVNGCGLTSHAGGAGLPNPWSSTRRCARTPWLLDAVRKRGDP